MILCYIQNICEVRNVGNDICCFGLENRVRERVCFEYSEYSAFDVVIATHSLLFV